MSTLQDNRIYKEPAPTMVDETREVTVVTTNPMMMLSQALERGASIEVLNKLMDLQERWEINNARKEYENAIADARAEIKPIKKNRKGNYGNYADMAGIASQLDPIIASHGLSYRFRSRVEDKHVVVTCIVSHRAGHSEENSVPGPVDTSGSKNNIQSIGSTLTYLQRYTLTMALGLSFEDNDDDDDGAKGVRIPRRPIRQPSTEMNDAIPEHDAETGEIKEPEVTSADVAKYDKELADAAEKGVVAMRAAYKLIPINVRPSLQSALDRRHLPRAKEVDALAAHTE